MLLKVVKIEVLKVVILVKFVNVFLFLSLFVEDW